MMHNIFIDNFRINKNPIFYEWLYKISFEKSMKIVIVPLIVKIFTSGFSEKSLSDTILKLIWHTNTRTAFIILFSNLIFTYIIFRANIFTLNSQIYSFLFYIKYNLFFFCSRIRIVGLHKIFFFRTPKNRQERPRPAQHKFWVKTGPG